MLFLNVCSSGLPLFYEGNENIGSICLVEL